MTEGEEEAEEVDVVKGEEGGREEGGEGEGVGGEGKEGEESCLGVVQI